MTLREVNERVVLVCGGRDYRDSRRVQVMLDHIRPTAIVHGGARGADDLADRYGKARGIPVVRIDAQWDFYGAKKAGPLRNGWMPKLVNVHLVVAFPGGSGTADMVRQAKRAGIEVLEVEG